MTTKPARSRWRATGLVSLSNLMTIGVMRAVRGSGLHCPSDVSIVGVDDFAWADIMNPPPTTIAQPIAEMTQIAISSLLDQIKSDAKSSGLRLRFEPKLVVRGILRILSMIDRRCSGLAPRRRLAGRQI